MNEINEFKPLDLVENPNGELFVVEGKKQDNEHLYGAISLTNPEFMIQTVSDKESRRVCSFPELPKAVRGLLNWKKFLERGSGNSFGTHHSTTIRIHDELTALLDTGD